MKTQMLMSCKGWMQGIFPEKTQSIASLLSPEEAQIFSLLPNPLAFEPQKLENDILDKVHPTWLAPFLRSLSAGEIPLFLSALQPYQAEKLSEMLGFSQQLFPLTHIAKQGLRKILRSQVTYGFDLVPPVFLPQSPFAFLLDLNKAQLLQLTRFLGLHDLAFEMRQIIATQQLKHIFSMLTKKEGEYLQSLIIHQEPLVFERLFLEKWDGSKPTLHKLLDKRGLNRLGNAVHQESESFIWYLTHQLDIHQGALLLKYRKKPTHARGEIILKEQIENIFKEVL